MNQYNCHSEELLLFSLPPSETSLQSREWIEYRPVNQISGSTVLDFNIAAQSSIDLKNSLLNVKLQLTEGDGTPLSEEVVAGLVNLPLQSIFRQVDVTFKKAQVSHTRTNYPYKAYIDIILKTNQSTQQSLLTSQLFYKDEGPETNDAKEGPNGGLFNRYVATSGGKIVDLEGPLFVDLFQQSRLLVNGVSIGIKLWPSHDAFRLITNSLNPDQKLQIIDVRFKLCVQRLNRGALVAHEKLLHAQPAMYPYLRSDIKTTSIAAGQYGYSVDDLFQGLVPNKLIVGLVSSVAYTGDYGKNPFYFQPYDCSSLGLYIDGQSYPSQPLQPNYEADQFKDCYRTLTHFRNDIDVSREDYKEGYCLYVLDVDTYYSFGTK